MKRIELPESRESRFIPNCPRQAESAIIADHWLKSKHWVAVVVGETLPDAENKCEDIAALFEVLSPKSTLSFQCFDQSPLPDHPDAFDRTCDRLTLLSLLRAIEGKAVAENYILIATTFEALLGKCPILEKTEDSEFLISCGNKLSFDKISKELVTKFDYSSEVVCEEPGQFAIRGGLIDIYPVNAANPVRIDFFGDTVEEIRTFDPTSQRATGCLNETIISSISNNDTEERLGEFLRYLPDSVLWYFNEPENLLRTHPLIFHATGKKASEKANISMIWDRSESPCDFFLATSEIDAGAGIFDQSPKIPLKIKELIPELDKCQFAEASFLDEKNNHNKTAKIIELLRKFQELEYKIFISIGAEVEQKRIESILHENGLPDLGYQTIPVGLHQGFACEKERGNLCLSSFMPSGGNGFIIVTSREILGRERSRRPMRSKRAQVLRREVDHALDFAELVDGDLLVHLQHGICRFITLGKIDQNGKSEEAITVEFADGILLHVPLQESHLLSRYVGLNKARPKLAKLGGKTWSKTREAAELAAIDLAADLLRLQASRDSEKGYAFSVDDKWQKEFEDSFPFSETTDQLRSIHEVKHDMESEKPMDRLVCGDVGYGKTEVAMRAAFKAIMDGKQVALLAPTTILCQQHLQTFAERMKEFPVAIEMLSRFRTTGQQKKILKGLLSGSLDMVIGTHRIFSDDIKFKDLGLLIIDEEQRFGVEHKEKLKRMKANIDVLTLSATPIPRTLYFAMVGVRSFSTIETAPVNRRPIRTEVVRGTNDILKRAVELEVRRGGQVFYLHNRVKSIDAVARKLNNLFPKLRILIGHGQMSESELERVMLDFIAGNADILLCTTIIESGLDIPNCNTILIEEADKFGLSQLYQLRGRVGRFTKQAYAYLLINPLLPVKDKARKRLSALRSTSSMGAGFKIALRDLELRGAGNLLGSEQSGHIAGVGFEMYCKLLRESVSRLKGEELSLRPSAVVRLDFLHTDETFTNEDVKGSMASCLPSTYINEPKLRIELYRKIAGIMELQEIAELKDELADRFGPVPLSVNALMHETEIKCLAQEAGFDSIANNGNELLCRKVRSSRKEGVQYLRISGNLPRVQANDPLLKLKEIIRFLKIYIHGKK